MSAHALLLNILNEFNTFNNKGALILDSIYHMTLKHFEFTFLASKR